VREDLVERETRAMANPEHLQILKQGVEAWNMWREQHRDIRPDLHGANFAWADLAGARLSRADLHRAACTGSARDTKF
jgi:hypothetical protein